MDSDEIGKGLQWMYGGGLHSDDRPARVFHKLVDDGLCVVVVAVLQPCKRTHGDDVAVAAHHRDGFQQMLALVAVHDHAAFRLQLPCTGIDVKHNDVHAQVHGRLLSRQTRAQTVVEEYHQQRLVFS